ncbi:hypothetical protein ACE2AJ_02995 [Aquihabitans daechungensis]|uniref:hypothetical protein n=1 Tax=Aquihabitans daechungensis TaxID=1052257 RepID=UPI003BA101F0
MPTALDDRRPTRTRRALAAVVLLVGLAGAAGCATPAPEEQELSDALVSSGISRKVADCTAAALTDSLSSSDLAEITERGSGGVPVDDPEKTDEDIDKLTQAMSACRDLHIASEPTTTTVPNSVPEGGDPSTTLVAPGTDGAELNPASTTTTAP